MSVTGNLDGGEGPPRTPYAFGDMDDEDIEKAGYKKVKEESIFVKMSKQLHEVSYRDYKKDPTSTPQQKVNKGIREINNMLAEMERVVNNNLKLKTEMGVDSSHFWKSSSKRMGQIYERMTRIGNKIRELSK